MFAPSATCARHRGRTLHELDVLYPTLSSDLVRKHREQNQSAMAALCSRYGRRSMKCSGGSTSTQLTALRLSGHVRESPTADVNGAERDELAGALEAKHERRQRFRPARRRYEEMQAMKAELEVARLRV